MPSIIFINVKSNYFKEHAAVSSPKSHEIGQRETTIYIFLWRWRINLVEKVWLSCSPSLWVWTFHTPSVHIIPLWTSVNSRVTNISDRRVAKTRNLSNQERQRYRIIVWWEVNEEVENSVDDGICFEFAAFWSDTYQTYCLRFRFVTAWREMWPLATVAYVLLYCNASGPK